MSLYRRHNIQVTGTGEQTMLLAHGFGCDQTMWRWLVPAFQDHYRLVLYDHLGAGHSDRSQYRPDKYSTLQGYAADLLEILDAVGGTPALYVLSLPTFCRVS